MKVLVTQCLTLSEDIQIIWSLLLIWLFGVSYYFIYFWFYFVSFYIYGCMFCMLLFNFVTFILIVMFMYSYCYVHSVLCILFHCVILCFVSTQMCTVLLPPGVNPIAVNKIYRYITSIWRPVLKLLLSPSVIPFVVEASWNVMPHAQKPDFVFRAKRTSPFKSAGRRQFSRLLAAEVCASAVVMLDTPCSEVMWRVLATHSIRQFPLHFPSRASPCAITFQLESTPFGLAQSRSAVSAAMSEHLLCSWHIDFLLL